MKIVISEFMDEAAIAGFSGNDRVLYAPGLVDDRLTLLAELADADALIVRNRTQVDADLLSAAPQLKVVGRLGVGLDNIDLDACRARGIEVCPATGANSLSVAEYVISCTLILLRGAFGSNASMIAGEWPRQRLVGREASGQTLGLIGYGEIARTVAALARPLGMHISAFDPFLSDDDRSWADVERHKTVAALLGSADVVSLHVPLTKQTHNLIDAAAIAAMKPGAILINTARGGIVDEAALANALRSGRLGGAALDVFAQEPLTAAAGAAFDGVPNLVLTPHIAGVTNEANGRVSTVTVENVKRVLSHA